ncbi:uncharacterized protein LAESUDRAFT_676206 [Laetiporus sulphureus 93-53]|uniref:Protein CPL1-like domain-containing protein n=1 Tax=Laetiporus sulphureus 93-53 TaxID=1314785 RepID=A0A165FD16_9APHY|nr:uncharacterized protein LAESUDRAFT_676206 [Laetiporus sulphureus 93-53]KZT08785.1 hypothetical protein LAESUDRAFT_676206 [Laetiporus sulphureus 93-53]
MRSALVAAIGLAVLAVLPVPAAALPGPTPAIQARAPGPSHGHDPHNDRRGPVRRTPVVQARAPGPSHGHDPHNDRRSPVVQARAPGPSHGHDPHNDRRAAAVQRGPQKREQQLIPAVQDVTHLCPLSMSACPISSSVPLSLMEWIEQGFECVDLSEDLNSCGGCGSVDTQFDCTAIPNALAVSCVVGGCHVDSCKTGYAIAADSKTCVSALA